MHPLDIRHGPAHHVPRDLQPEVIPWFQKHTVRLHQPLPHRPIGGFSEISALRMLQMGAPRNQRDFHIRNRRADQYAAMLLFLQMRQNQPLPVPIQLIFTAVRSDGQPAPGFSRLHQQMYLRIMTKGLKMSHPFHCIGDGLFIHDIPRSKLNGHAETFLNQAS